MRIAILYLCITVLFVIFFPSITLASTVQIEALVAGCGDGIINGTEECDGVNLGGSTCQTEAFYGGFISCKNDCTLDTSLCFSDPSVSAGGFIISGFRPLKLLDFKESAIESICDQNLNFQDYLDCIFIRPVELKPLPLESKSPEITDYRTMQPIDQEVDMKDLDEGYDIESPPSIVPGEEFKFFASEKIFSMILFIFITFTIFMLLIEYRIRRKK